MVEIQRIKFDSLGVERALLDPTFHLMFLSLASVMACDTATGLPDPCILEEYAQYRDLGIAEQAFFSDFFNLFLYGSSQLIGVFHGVSEIYSWAYPQTDLFNRRGILLQKHAFKGYQITRQLNQLSLQPRLRMGNVPLEIHLWHRCTLLKSSLYNNSASVHLAGSPAFRHFSHQVQQRIDQAVQIFQARTRTTP